MLLLLIFSIIYSVLSLIAIATIILYGSNPSKSLGWILIVITLPIGGVLLYVLFGVNRREFKILTLKETEKRRLYDSNYLSKSNVDHSFLPTLKQRKLANLIAKSSNFVALEGNYVTVLNTGTQTYKLMFDKLKKAKNYIHIQFYIFEEGDVLDEFYKIFKNKIKEGVTVRILYDAIGSMSWSNKSIKRFKNIGVEISPILPIKFGSILFNLNFRNHRKIIVIDGEVGFTGGVNISDKYVRSLSKLGIWDDEHVCIEGPAVQSLHEIFIKDYYFATGKEVLLEEKYHKSIGKKGDKIVQIVASGPDSEYSSIMQQYAMLIYMAEDNIYIANPYFIPTKSVLEAIKIAALSNVKVKLLIPAQSDSKMAKYSMYSNFKQLLKVGVKIYRSPNFLHSKVIVIDNELASIGSGNFDHRSFDQNFEANALIYNSDVATEIAGRFEKNCEKANELTLEEHESRSLGNKLLEGVFRLFSPLL